MELLVSRHGRLGRLRLNRPKALNSLTLDMVRAFTHALRDFAADPDVAAVLVTGEGERGLCAGGDIRALYELRDGDKNHYRTFWREEYQLNAMIASFQKPYVVLMDGLVMGGGVGVSAHGNCRIVTERTRLAMPETGIGFIPDVGGAWLLTRNGGAGVYMALSGAVVSGADAIHVGLADAHIESGRIPDLINRCGSIKTAEDVSRIVQDLSRAPEPGELERNKELLDRVFTGDRLEDLLVALRTSASAFVREAAVEIGKKSPTSLKATYALLRRALTADSLEECLVSDYRAACSLLESHDLYEGIRAAIIDKDKSPKWRPASVDEVDDATVARILAGDGSPPPVFSAS